MLRNSRFARAQAAGISGVVHEGGLDARALDLHRIVRASELQRWDAGEGRHHGTVSVRPRTEVSGIHARGQRQLESRGVIARACTGGTGGTVGLCVESRGYRPPVR